MADRRARGGRRTIVAVRPSLVCYVAALGLIASTIGIVDDDDMGDWLGLSPCGWF